MVRERNKIKRNDIEEKKTTVKTKTIGKEKKVSQKKKGLTKTSKKK